MAQTIPKLLQEIVAQYPEVNAQMGKDKDGEFHPRKYKELYQEVQHFAAGLQKLKVKRGDHVGLI